MVSNMQLQGQLNAAGQIAVSICCCDTRPLGAVQGSMKLKMKMMLIHW